MKNEIVIRRPRMILCLWESEILELLKGSPSLWAKALKRGKGLLRYEKAMERIGK